MHHSHRPRRPWRAAIATFAATAVALGLVAAVALALEIRDDVARTGEPLAQAAAATAGRIDPARTAAARATLAEAGGAARLLGPAGRVRVEAGEASLWDAGDPAMIGALAAIRADGWTLRDGVVEARGALPTGGAVVLRAPLPAGAATATGTAGVMVPVILLALLAAAAVWILASRQARRLRDITLAAEAMAAGRTAAIAPAGRGEWLRASAAVGAAAERSAALQAAAEARVGALGAALAPLAHPVAARTPSGSLIRNEALERLVGSLALPDAGQVDDAVAMGLAAAGPVSRRIALSDGRAFEMEAWAVPGGRVVAVGERTEQARMEAMRRQVTGAAARHLQAPVSEIQALGSDLLGHVPASALPAVRRIQAAGDRMERLVSQLLRGTANDPPRALGEAAAPSARRAWPTVSAPRSTVASARSRPPARETDLPADLPPLRTDAALAHEILSELIANAANLHPARGDDHALRTRPAGRPRGGRTVTDDRAGRRAPRRAGHGR
jgi:signal transduction histidine kinase